MPKDLEPFYVIIACMLEPILLPPYAFTDFTPVDIPLLNDLVSENSPLL